MSTTPVLLAFLLTVLAGLATGIGSAMAFFTRQTNTKMLSVSLGFSAGVMIYISFVELLADSQVILARHLGKGRGEWLAIGAFFTGLLLIAVLDRLVPQVKNPHEIHRVEEMGHTPPADREKLYRTGIFTAVIIAIHNFPEGLATFAAALQDLSLGLPIALAIAIHNIPEGIAVSIPIYYATGSKNKAFAYSFLSGLSEPLGALIGFLLLLPFFNEYVFGVLSAIIAGIMVFISLDELLPSAEEYGEHHLTIYGLIAGMGIMALSLLLLK